MRWKDAEGKVGLGKELGDRCTPALLSTHDDGVAARSSQRRDTAVGIHGLHGIASIDDRAVRKGDVGGGQLFSVGKPNVMT